MSEKLLPLFGNLTHGVYVIGVFAMGKKNAFTAAKSVASDSSSHLPPDTIKP